MLTSMLCYCLLPESCRVQCKTVVGLLKLDASSTRTRKKTEEKYTDLEALVATMGRRK